MKDAFAAWWEESEGKGDAYGCRETARAAWGAATERAAKLVEGRPTCECEERARGGGLDWCECYGYRTFRDLAARIRGD